MSTSRKALRSKHPANKGRHVLHIVGNRVSWLTVETAELAVIASQWAFEAARPCNLTARKLGYQNPGEIRSTPKGLEVCLPVV